MTPTTSSTSLPDRWLVDWDRSDRMPFYTRANAGEVLADPASPLGWTLVFEKGLLPGWLRGLVEFGIYRDGELPSSRPPVVGLFGGYFYINLSHCRVMAVRMGMTVEAFDAALLGSADIAPPYQPHPDDENADCSVAVGATIAGVLGVAEFPELDADLARVLGIRRDRPDLTTLSDAELVTRARSLLPELDNAFAVHDYSTLGSAVGPAMLGEICAGAGRSELLLDLISGLGEVRSASPTWGLWDLSRQVTASADLTALFDEGITAVSAALADDANRATAGFRVALAAFLAEYGQRGPDEWDIRSVSWEADPHQVLALVDRLRHSGDENAPDRRHERLEASRLSAADRVREALAGDAVATQTFEVALASAARMIPLREQTKLIAVTAINEVRMAIRELGRRGAAAGLFAAPEDVMMLVESELDDYVANPAAFAAVIRERLGQYRQLFELEPPFILDVDPAPLTQWPRRKRPRPDPVTAGEVLRGVGGSAGTFEGRARVVHDLQAAMALEPGEVLVAPITDAAWTPLFLVAGAVVVDVGALNSHAVVVSRELGIPCVLSIEDATARLRNGMVLAVDGNAGTITVVSA